MSRKKPRDWRQMLADLFIVDESDKSKGIKISLPKSQGQGQGQRDVARPAPGYGIHIANGRVVRESRHAGSAYTDWTQPIGPAETELEKKTGLSRKQNNDPPLNLSDLEYAVIDTETTGSGFGHRITEIAIVRLNADGKVLHEYSTLVNPGRSIPPEITALTHITHDMVRVAPRFEDIADDVRFLLQDRIFVAHNAPFDWGFITKELVRTTGRPLAGRRLCTVRLARRVVPELRSRSLDSLSYFFNVRNEARHRAFGDARATAVIFRRMMDRVYERDITTWQALENMTLRRSQRRKRTAMPTGIEFI